MRHMIHPIRTTAFAHLVLASLLVAACGHGDDGHGHEHSDAAPVDCTTEDRADDYVAGLSKTGSSGYVVILEASDPAPPAKGDNTWTVQVMDDGSATLDGAVLTVTPFMPDHGHGTPIGAEVTPVGADGRYTIAPVNLWMPGLWEVTIDVDDQGTTDSVVYSFCIDG